MIHRVGISTAAKSYALVCHLRPKAAAVYSYSTGQRIALKNVGWGAEKVLLMGERDGREAGYRTPIHRLSS